MKKLLSVLLVFALMFSFAACGAKQEAETTVANDTEIKTAPAVTDVATPYEAVDIRVATLMGPSGVSMAKIWADQEAGTAKNNYKFTLLDTPTKVIPGILANADGEVLYDIASVPVNVASVLYNKSKGQIQIISADTKGVLYVLEQGETIKTIEDLAGKTVYATGKGMTPEHIFNYILEKNNLTDKVKVEYLETHDELAAKVAAGEIAISILPQPKVTIAMSKNPKLRVALDLTAEFEKVSGGKSLVMGVVVARKAFVDEHPEAVDMFLKEYKASIEYASTNLDETAQNCETFKIIPKAALAKQAIPKCNISYMAGADMKDIVKTNLQLFFDADPKSIGGQMPSDDFYYGA